MKQKPNPQILSFPEIKRVATKYHQYKRNETLISDQINDLLKPLDRKQSQLEATYGFGTLEAAAPDEIRKRFQLAQVSLHHAIQEKNITLIQQKIHNLTLGWDLLEQNAIKRNLPTLEDLDPDMWHHTAADGSRFIFVRDVDHMKRIPKESRTPGTRILTLNEIGIMINWWDQQEGSDVTNEIKQQFPNSELTEIHAIDTRETESEKT
tara:strand:- start:1547 stop:2170 length:624 start_codon:yes stop_codon:yes gene_type:complete